MHFVLGNVYRLHCINLLKYYNAQAIKIQTTVMSFIRFTSHNSYYYYAVEKYLSPNYHNEYPLPSSWTWFDEVVITAFLFYSSRIDLSRIALEYHEDLCFHSRIKCFSTVGKTVWMQGMIHELNQGLSNFDFLINSFFIREGNF